MPIRTQARLVAGVVASTALAVSLSSAPASADRDRQHQAGHTTFAIKRQIAKQMVAGCNDGGPVYLLSIGNATVKSNHDIARIRMPVTAIATTDAGHMRIVHDGSGFELVNNCYDITFTNFYVQDLGQGASASGFQVLARDVNTNGEDGRPRMRNFSVDMSNANVTLTGGVVKVRAATLSLGDQGAAELNQMAGDTTGTAGPFTSGEQIGRTQTFYRSVP